MQGKRDGVPPSTASHSILKSLWYFLPKNQQKTMMEDSAEVFTGPENLMQWKPTPCLCPLHPRPLLQTTMSHWHDWYEGNCAFCSNPSHMRRIKYSSSQNLLLVNELLIQAASSHLRSLHLPTAAGPESSLSNSDIHVPL